MSDHLISWWVCFIIIYLSSWNVLAVLLDFASVIYHVLLAPAWIGNNKVSSCNLFLFIIWIWIYRDHSFRYIQTFFRPKIIKHRKTKIALCWIMYTWNLFRGKGSFNMIPWVHLQTTSSDALWNILIIYFNHQKCSDSCIKQNGS